MAEAEGESLLNMRRSLLIIEIGGKIQSVIWLVTILRSQSDLRRFQPVENAPGSCIIQINAPPVVGRVL